MFNERKLTAGHGFVKAYSNNWLSQLGAVYKYESPKDVLRKPNNQHRKIALYSILAMAFVAFFTLFMIVHEAERKSRQALIESSFGNETAIEPSAGGFNTILTTPLSASGGGVLGMGNGSAAGSVDNDRPRGADANGTERARGVGREKAMKRTRRLRYFSEGMEVPSNRGPVMVGRDRLVVLPARFLKPPARDADSHRGRWSSEEPAMLPIREEAERRRDAAVDSANPKPFQFAPNGPLPVGFQQKQPQPAASQQTRANRSHDALTSDWGPVSIEDIIRQLTLAKRKQQQQFYYNYPYRPSPQPAEFNHPVHQNHRVKFTGIYRHPRKNGDITTVFGSASQRPQEVHLQAPQLINQQLGGMGSGVSLMPDRLYNFKPQHPSEVNLLATDQFRFAPQKDSQEAGSWENRWPKEGMPFSVMLNLEPMAIGGRAPVQQQQHQQQYQQQPYQQLRYKKRYRNPLRNAYRQSSWGTGGNYGEQHFAQLSPYHHRTRQQHHLYRDAFGHQAGGDDYEGENYFRKDGRATGPRVPAFASPLIGPGRLMVHFNIFPKQQPLAARRNSGQVAGDDGRFQPTRAPFELNTGEERTKDTELVVASIRPTVPADEPLFHPPFTLNSGRLEGGRSLGELNPSPTIATPWASTPLADHQPSPTTTTTTVEQPTLPSSPTVEVIRSIELPTQINFDHVPLGRNPPPPLPSFNRWTSDEQTARLWSSSQSQSVSSVAA